MDILPDNCLFAIKIFKYDLILPYDDSLQIEEFRNRLFYPLTIYRSSKIKYLDKAGSCLWLDTNQIYKFTLKPENCVTIQCNESNLGIISYQEPVNGVIIIPPPNRIWTSHCEVGLPRHPIQPRGKKFCSANSLP